MENLKIKSLHPSKSNPGGRLEGDEFDDLVASVKEKGVLIPLLVRETKKGAYEVIAGNRRLAAAKVAGVDDVPVRIVKMNDAEAIEAQIIENLQRKDVHPMEEGAAYRNLLEKFKGDVKSLALRVGKNEKYVRGRLYLTDLIVPFQKWYRDGKMLDAQAVMLAKLKPADQEAAHKGLQEQSWRLRDVQELKEWISDMFDQPLKNQPWLKDPAMLKAVGPCVECKPVASSTLFGEKPVEGKCSSMACWRRKMAAYIKVRMDADPKMIRIKDSYGEAPSGVLSESHYKKVLGKDSCENAVAGIVVQGENMGSVIKVCPEGTACPKHGNKISAVRMSPAEQKKRLAERQKEEKEAAAAFAKQAKFAAEMIDLDKDGFAVVFCQVALRGFGLDQCRPFVRAKGWEIDIKVMDGIKRKQYQAAFDREMAKLGAKAKMALALEAFMSTYGFAEENIRSALKKSKK